jgi:FtsH-binding integral membrane protein
MSIGFLAAIVNDAVGPSAWRDHRDQEDATMSNYDPNAAASRAVADRAIPIDAGLRAHMLRVYNYMTTGVGLTGLVAMLTYQFTGPELLQSPLMWVFMLAPLALVFFISARINTLSAETARLLFFIYAAVVGISLSTIFHVYTSVSIARVFFISAAAFGALSLWGYTTRRDLSGMGTFLFMGLIGIVIASLVNLFLRSSGMDWIISIIGVGVFAGLTAYDTQRIKAMYDSGDDATSAGRKAVMGALSLYLNFINLFMMMLRLMGGRR